MQEITPCQAFAGIMCENNSPGNVDVQNGDRSPRKLSGFLPALALFRPLDLSKRRPATMDRFWRLWREEKGQDIAEYAVMLAVILVIVVGTIRLIGSNANNVFSNVASSIQ
jgi:Flp pilus assembly pilin Flp